MRRRRNPRVALKDNADLNSILAKDLIELWSLRAIVKLGGINEFVSREDYFSNDELASFLGLDSFLEEDAKFKKSDIFTILNRRLKEIELKPLPKPSNILQKNIKKITKLVELSQTEIDILTLAIYVGYTEELAKATDTLGDLSTDKTFRVVSALLDIPLNSVQNAFSSSSNLAKSALVLIDRDWDRNLRDKLETISKEFADKMINLDEPVEELLRDSFRKTSSPSLKIDDYSHIKKDMDILSNFLKNAIKDKRQGTNILLYGPPGTGKTELVKTLGKLLKTELYEISYTDKDGDPSNEKERLKALKTAQAFLQKKKVFLMFDESEDVFDFDGDPLMGSTRKKQSNKAWLNRILEENTLPTVWITNNVHGIDNALVRRFDLSIQIPIPPKKRRKEIIKDKCRDLISDKDLKKLAKNSHISPAVIDKAAEVVKSIQDTTPNTSKAIKKIVNNTLKAQGYIDWTKIFSDKEKKKKEKSNLPSHYNPSYINTQTDLDELTKGIKQNPNARLCLYGPPGTGKSAYGKYLAEYLKRPFILKKGSDLISKWVGDTEKNIATAFEEAKKKKAVLVFDEVDSFLQDRRDAKNSWEVTKVNEMLVQMENFKGIFIATTNLMDGLDQASIRRFDLKMEFGYLKEDQAWELFQDECKALKIEAPKKDLKADLKGISSVTPGDFAAVRRQNRFRPIKTAKELYKRVLDECKVKNEDSSRKLGFM